jgi:UDP-N-acetylmuramate dehydrogenase
MIKTEYYKDLTKLNTFGMKVKAHCFIEYDSLVDLVEIDFEELGRPVLHIGGGSNLLFTDDFKGTVLHSKINFIEPLEGEEGDESVCVSVGSGVKFDDFCAWAAENGLWGVENLSHIPGEVGAAAIQNIGAYGVEVKDVIKMVGCYDTVDEEFVNIDVEDCEYGYRDSAFKDPEIKGRYIVTHVVFELSKTPKLRLEYGNLAETVAKLSKGEPTLASIRKAVMQTRKEKLPEPSVMGSAGSFFKNPVVGQEEFQKIVSVAKAELGGDYEVPHYDLEDGKVKVPAAWMIEQCGFKGKRSGGAAVYDKQPLVIVNYTGEAYPEEILGMEKRIVSSVKSKFGIELQPEVEHI